MRNGLCEAAPLRVEAPSGEGYRGQLHVGRAGRYNGRMTTQQPCVEMRTVDLIDLALDWAVSDCEGYKLTTDGISLLLERGKEVRILGPNTSSLAYSPSTDRALALEIVEREGIDLHQSRQRSHGLFEWNEVRARMPGAEEVEREFSRGGQTWSRRFVRIPNKPRPNDGKWFARMAVDNHTFGWSPKDFMSDTPAVAAMRCFVASQRGEIVKIPVAVLARMSQALPEVPAPRRARARQAGG